MQGSFAQLPPLCARSSPRMIFRQLPWRRRVSALGLAVAMAIAVSVPAVEMLRTYDEQQSSVALKARLSAAVLARHVADLRRLRPGERVRLAELIGPMDIDGGDIRQRVLDADGTVALETGAALDRPILTARMPITIGAETVGVVEVHASLRPFLRHSAFAAVAGLVLGFIAYFAARVIPVRVLDRTLEAMSEIVAQHASAEAVRQSEARYSGLVGNLQQVVFQVDEKGRFTFLNPAWQRIMGYAVEETVGRAHLFYVHADDRRRHRANIERAAEAGGCTTYELRCVAKDGSIKWLECSVTVAVDAGQKIVGLSGTLADVTDRHQAAEALCASEARYAENAAVLKATLENISQGIMMIAPDGTVPVINRRAMDLLGLSEDLVSSPSFNSILQWQREAGEFGIHERRLPNGMVLEIRTIPLEGGGVVNTYTDVSELVRAKEKSDAGSQAKSAFLASMSHEIRTPLNGVVGTASLLHETELSAEQRRHVETIQECSDTLLELINDILDFSKVEAGRLDLETTEFSLVELAESVIDIVEPKARPRDLILALSASAKLSARVLGDAGRLRQVLLNLMGNAIKFTDRGSVVLKIFPEGKGDVVRFEVHDTGIGIPAEARDRLFREFSQVEASITRRYGGTGLGLAICARLVAAMGGRIGFDSEPGEGSLFWFEVPLQAGAATAPGPRLIGAKRRAVLVAPSGPGREATRELLASFGFEVVGADSTRVGDCDVAVLHHSALPQAPFARRPHDGARPWLVFGFGASRWSRNVEGVLDGAVKPSDLADVLATILDGVAPKPAKAQPKHRTPARRLRVLLVEDNHVNQRVATRLLKNIGHDVDLAADGYEAIAQVRSRSYDIILMDMQMPRMNGLDATRTIRALPGEGARVPIVAMTANAFQSDREACLAAGMDDFMSKPVTRDKLFDILEHWSAQRAQPGAGRRGGEAAMQAAGPSPASTAEAVDVTHLETLRHELGEEMLAELLTAFWAGAADLMQHIQASIAGNDRAAAAELVHKLKGSAATLGFTAVAGACDGLRKRLLGDEPVDVADALAALLNSLREGEAAMRPRPAETPRALRA
jgi:PAS domain S-box-containing protein